MTSPPARRIATEAFVKRVERDAGEKAGGVRVVDFLGESHIFRGLRWKNNKWNVQCAKTV
jgi:hypothetical protein